MKKLKQLGKFGVGLLTLALIGGNGVQAQESGDSLSSINLSSITANGVLTLNGTNVSTIGQLTDLQLNVLVNALNATPTISADSLPSGGTFWSLQNPGFPPLPVDTSGSAVWPMADGSLLLNDVDYDYSAPPTLTASPMSMGMMTMSAESLPGLPGDGGTNTYTPNNLSGGVPVGGTNLWIAQTAVTNGYLTAIGTNTVADVAYTIFSVTNLLQVTNGWQSEGVIFGSELTNWTPFSVAQNSRANLFVQLRSEQSDDGSGIPDWWEQLYFGTNIVDPNALDSAGDGWSIYQKYQIGVNPSTWVIPAAPQNFAASYDASSGNVTLTWQPAAGAVTGYTVSKIDGYTESESTFNISASSSSLADNILGDEPDDPMGEGPTLYVSYTIHAKYTNGISLPANTLLEPYNTSASLVAGPEGTAYIAVPNLPPRTASLLVSRIDAYALDQGTPSPASCITSAITPLSSGAGGFYPVPASVMAGPADGYGYSYYYWFVQPLDTNNTALGASQIVSYGGYAADNFNSRLVAPYIDGRAALKDNLRFLLREGSVATPFAMENVSRYEVAQTNYVVSGFYNCDPQVLTANFYIDYQPAFDPLRGLEDNCLYRDFAFSPNYLDATGFPNTGIAWGDDDFFNAALCFNTTPTFNFDISGAINYGNNTTFSSVSTTNVTRWLLPFYYYDTFSAQFPETNIYGLQVLSDELTYLTNNQIQYGTYRANGALPGMGYWRYTETEQPAFANAGYYFGVPGINLLPVQNNPYFWGNDAWPQFSTTNQTQTLLAAVGQPTRIAGYAKLAVLNAYTNTFAYLGQYFDQAYTTTNGVATSTNTGVLSEYGDFFPTQPGQTALITMPDIDPPYQRGTCMVYCVSLQLDKNHDGIIDTTFNGPDATSTNSPFVFWANNNFDRWHTVDGNDAEQDDLSPAQLANLNVPAEQKVPDCQYKTNGLNAIPCTRDLEDYFRLWLPGIASAMKAMPANYTVQLTLTGDGQIRIFHAVEPNGGTNYLFDATTASNQVAQSASLYVGLLTSSSPVVFSITTNFNEHFIICGAQTGSAQVDLQILDGNGNVVADSPTYLQINDIKQMYERWTVGDTPSRPALANALAATEDLPAYTAAFQYTAPTDTNTPYILFVHGWNMERWEKDRFAEAAYKRLYWQGYKGRFGSFRWPTHFDFGAPGSGSANTPLNNPQNFDDSESNAWASAVGLLNKLSDLNTKYPGNVYLMAHSMGNVVAGEALRLAGGSQPVNTYIAMQGAIASHTYDPTAPTRSLGVLLDSATPNRYAHYPTNGGACYFNASAGAETYVNFFNTNDWALNSDHWQLDQDSKPDFGYTYDAYNGRFFRGTVILDELFFPANTYELFSYCIEARCYALGAQSGVGGVFGGNQVNLPNVWPPDLDGYIAHKWHSAEFRSDNMQRAIFWNTLLTKMKLK